MKLPEPERYTGHIFRRSRATLLADTGADITSIMRFGGWKSQAVAASYTGDSMGVERKIFNNMANKLAINIPSSMLKQQTTLRIGTGFTRSSNALPSASEFPPVVEYQNLPSPS